MSNDDYKGNEIPKKSLQAARKNGDARTGHGISRRDLMRYTAAVVASAFFGSLTSGCDRIGAVKQVAGYPIDANVSTTAQRMISFPYTMSSVPPNMMKTPPPSPNGKPGLAVTDLCKVAEYDSLGYGAWTFGAPLPVVPRTDIMPTGYAAKAGAKKTKVLNFLAITDIHITDKESPNQLIYLQQLDGVNSGSNTSIYSPIMMYTTHVLDAAIQTANALHKKNPFDFAISLGDTCNCTSYNELRWYIDVIDGKVITPSSGAHLGADTIDYQKPYKAAGLDKSIPWYQALGNHDHFYIGSFPIDADPSVGLRQSYISDTVWAVPAFLVPNPAAFPAMFNMENMKATPKYYGGVIDGSTPLGNVINTGAVEKASVPKVVADPDRRSLLRTEWIQEFFKTSSTPVGHGLNLVNPGQPSGFACYSFLPKADVPLKVIVLDDTQAETDGSTDIHGHGYLDATRWAWLQAELKAGQDANQLMIIAAHIPIAVVGIGGETEWWLGGKTATNPLGDASTTTQNAVTLAGLVQTLQNTPNLLMWIAGHRHVNAVKAFVSPDPVNAPEKGFWQVETSSLRDWPQQLRTFEIYINSDYTVSIVTTNVDPAVAAGTPAATSRKYAIAAQQIVQNNSLTASTPNVATVGTAPNTIPVPSMDPTRPQDAKTDPTIKYVDLSNLPSKSVPYNASYNAELYKPLSSQMVDALKKKYPKAS